MTDDVIDQQQTPFDDGAAADPDAGVESTQYGVGPFSVREVALAGVWLVAFVISFFSLYTLGFASVWTAGLDWILTIGLPTVAVFLLVLRRLSPQGIRRVGSLGIDQFASVAFSVSAMLWVQYVWTTVAQAMASGYWVRTWVLWVELVLMLAGVVLTVFAPIIPVLRDDFEGRREIPAHRNARPIRPVIARPRPEPKPAADEAPASEAQHAPGAPATSLFDLDDHGGQPEATGDLDATILTSAGPQRRGSFEAPAAQHPAIGQAAAPQPFWALAPTERDVVDEIGTPLFRVGPTAWALVIEDRGALFVIRHDDGRIGYLHDVSGITRG